MTWRPAPSRLPSRLAFTRGAARLVVVVEPDLQPGTATLRCYERPQPGERWQRTRVPADLFDHAQALVLETARGARRTR